MPCLAEAVEHHHPVLHQRVRVVLTVTPAHRHKLGATKQLTADALAAAAEDGLEIGALGMFEQAFTIKWASAWVGPAVASNRDRRRRK